MVNYTYSKLPTINFNTTPASVARSATGSVYAVGDTTYTTPLNMTLVVGGSVVTSISSDALGMLPDFTLLDRTSCVWKQTGASFATVLTTTDPVPGPAGATGGTGATGAQGVPGDVSTWKATTFYPLNTPVTNPSGDLVKVTTAHTSTGSYDATKFTTAYDSAVQTLVNTSGTATQVALSATYASILTPENFGALGDGATNDYTAFANMSASAFSKLAVLQKGKTYKIGQSLTISKELDLNGATLEVTGRLTVTSGVLRNGTVKTSDKIAFANLTRVRVENVTHMPTATGSSGIEISGCSNILVTKCTTVGGFRGINLINCDKFEVSGNVISGADGTGAYGILVTATAGTVHGDGSIHHNLVTDCMVTISLFGGEADSTKPGYVAGDYTLQKISVHHNTVTITDIDALIGCIFATRARYISVSDNMVTGGKDVGVDFEHCADSGAYNNVITNIELGALAAIFGSKRIMFSGNKITYSAAKAGSVATSGRSWKNTSNFVVLLRNSPEDITIDGNEFRSLNGTLGQFDLATDSKNISVTRNKLINCYMSGSNSTAGLVTGLRINDNDFSFTINVNNPVIMHETVTDLSIERNQITLAAGEVLESANRPYITVRDFALANASENVRIRGNEIYGGGTIGIGLHTYNPAIRAWVDGNLTDRITGYYNAAAPYVNMTLERNYKATTVVPPVLTLGTTGASGGTFGAGTYYWKVTAQTALTQSAGSNEVTATVVANGTQALTWAAVSGASGYKVFRGTAPGAGYTLIGTLGQVTTYTDTGAAGTAGSPQPTTSAPGYVKLTAHDNAPLNLVTATLS